MTALPAHNYLTDSARTQGEVKAGIEATLDFIREKFSSTSVAITSIASAATVDLGGAASDSVLITGTTGPVTSFGTAPAGTRRYVRTASTPTFTHSASLQCPGGVSFTASAGTTFEAESLGSGNWIIRSLQLGTGIGSMALLASGTVSGAAALDLTLPSGYKAFKLLLNDFRPATNLATLQWRVSFDNGSTYISTASYTDVSMYYQSALVSGTAGASVSSAATVARLSYAIDNAANYGNAVDATIFPGTPTSFVNVKAQSGFLSSGNVYISTWDTIYQGGNGRATNLRLFFSSGNIQTMTYALYGIM